MVAARFLGAAAARAILGSFAAGMVNRIGAAASMKAAIVICQRIFLKLGADHVPFNIPFRTASNSSFATLVPRSGFGAAISKGSLCKSLLCLQKIAVCKSFPRVL